MKKTQVKEMEKFSSAEELIRKVNEVSFDFDDVDVNLVQRCRNKNDVELKLRESMPSVMKNVKKNTLYKLDTSSFPKEFENTNGESVTLNSIDNSDLNDEPQKLPAVISKEIIAAGISDVKWTNLKHLHPLMHDDIALITRENFKSFNIDKNADIMTISSLSDNDLLNKPLEVNSVLDFLEKNLPDPFTGVMTQDHGEVIKFYLPKIRVFHSKDMAYLVVHEPKGVGIEGNYIYAFKRKQDLKLKNEKKARISKKP